MATLAPIAKPVEVTHRAYARFSALRRVEHLFLILSFTVLAVTGLPQKFAGEAWAETMIGWMGGIESVRVIHHASAIVLILVSIVEFLIVGYKLFVERARWTMVPRLQDGWDALHQFLYNLGLRSNAPKYDRYGWGEKFEYWALIWGTVIMAITGFILWNPIWSARILPGEIIPAAKAAHGGEALLAVLAVVTWHFYNVHFKTLNKSMLTGTMSAEEMEEEHPLELERLKKEADSAAAVKDVEKRRRLYLPIAAAVGAVLVLGVYFAATGEATAITTISPAVHARQAYVPRTFTPTATRVMTSTPIPPPATPTTVPVARAPAAQATAPAIPFVPASHEGRTSCQVCHSTGVSEAPINPPDHKGRLDSTCTSCHQLETDLKGAISATAVPDAGAPATPAASGIPFIPESHEGRTNCQVCHATGFSEAPISPPDHEGRLDSTCTSCHQLESDLKSAISATDVATPLAGTPTVVPTSETPAAPAASGIPFIPESHEGRTNCQVCHATGFSEAPVSPPDHEGRLDSTCTLCHQLESDLKGAIAATDVATPLADTPTIVPVAGTPLAGTPTVVPASGTPVAPAASGIPFIPESHEGRTSCQVCHATGFSEAPVSPPDHEGRLDSTCTSCHQLESDLRGAIAGAAVPTPPAVPASHEGRTTCQVCHATGFSEAPISPPDHEGRVDSTCLACHKPEE